MSGVVSHSHAKAALVLGIIEVAFGVTILAIVLALNGITSSSTSDIPASPFMNIGAVSSLSYNYNVIKLSILYSQFGNIIVTVPLFLLRIQLMFFITINIIKYKQTNKILYIFRCKRDT